MPYIAAAWLYQASLKGVPAARTVATLVWFAVLKREKVSLHVKV